MTRCKFKCTKKSEHEGDHKSFEFAPVYSQDENSENKKFWKFTPSGKLEFVCVNPNVDFEVGKEYFIDISLAVKE